MSSIDLNKILIFSKVADLQSFTRAADELGIEKSTVSSNIAELEKKLGVRLLNRTTRSVTLTEAGEGYYRYCQKVVETAHEAELFIQSLNEEPQGLLRISTPEGLGRILFDDLFNQFMKQYPQINLELFLNSRAVDIIKERYDMVIRVSRAKLNDSSLIGRLLFTVKNGLFISRTYAQEHPFRDIREVAEHRIITLDPYMASDLLPKEICRGTKEIKNRVSVNDIEGSIKAVEAGLGIGVLPVSSLKEELESGDIIRIFPESPLLPIYLYALYPSRQWMSSKLKVFLDFLFDWAARQEAQNSDIEF
jgi:DNA-binding transcriptional LysR family regulator